MQRRPGHQSLLSSLVWLFGFTIYAVVGSSLSPIFAQASVDLSVNVNATVPDWVAPSTPILVAPVDGSSITDSTPTFIWQAATDNVGVTGYALYLDGNVYIASIPTTGTDTSVFTLTFDSGTSRYSLTPKSSISDGSHTWKIVARDSANNTTSSVTWTFLIDSQAPTFVITTIGETTTSISVQDSSTIPSEAIKLTENEPTLSGTGEANSTVVLHLRKASDDSLVEDYSFSIGSDGVWSVKLYTLERDVVYNLSFQITDRVGLLSILEDVPIILPSLVIEIPIPEDVLPIDSPLVIPLQTVPMESFSRIAHIIHLEITEVATAVTAALIPEEIRATLISARQTSVRFLSPVWYTHLLVLFLLFALPLVKWVLLATPFGRNFSFNIGWTIWLAIIGFSSKKQHSLIVSATDQQVQPFVTVRFIPVQQTAETSTTNETLLLMSDQHGFLPNLPTITGEYRLIISQDEVPREYPKSRPAHLAWTDWYQGQSLQLTANQKLIPLIIPVMPCTSDQGRKRWKTWLLNRRIDSVTIFCMAILVLIMTPTIGNFIVTAVFGVLWLTKSWRRRQVDTYFTVISLNKEPVAYTIIRLARNNATQMPLLAPTNSNGETALRLKTGEIEFNSISGQFRQKNRQIVTRNGNEEQHVVALMTAIFP